MLIFPGRTSSFTPSLRVGAEKQLPCSSRPVACLPTRSQADHRCYRNQAQYAKVFDIRTDGVSIIFRSLAVGGTVDDVEGQTKRLATFAKALSTLDERSKALSHTAQELIDARHMEKNNIDIWRRKVEEALASLCGDIDQRRAVLGEAYALAAFDSDVADMESWIEDKLKGIRADYENQGQLLSIEDKMKRLQRHQALEAELASNKTRVDQVLQRGRELFARHNNPDITARSDVLMNRWTMLVNACADQSRALEEFRDLLAFRQLVDRVLHWIRDKELLVATREMGRDQEHCKQILARLDGSTADSSVDEQTLDDINRLGAKLVSQGRSSREEVEQQQRHLNQTYNFCTSNHTPVLGGDLFMERLILTAVIFTLLWKSTTSMPKSMTPMRESLKRLLP